MTTLTDEAAALLDRLIEKQRDIEEANDLLTAEQARYVRKLHLTWCRALERWRRRRVS